MEGVLIGGNNMSTVETTVGRMSRKYRLTVTYANGLKIVLNIRWRDRNGSQPPALRVSCVDPACTVAITLAWPMCTINLHTQAYHARVHLMVPPQDANRMMGIDSDEVYYTDGRSHKAVDRVWAVPSWVVPASLDTV